MARAARLAVTTPSPGRAKAAGSATKPVKKSVLLPKPSPFAAAAPKPSKHELRVQVEALERTGATLKAKAKVTRAAARQTGARIAELEDEVSQLEGALAKASHAAPAKAPRAAVRARKQPRELDPGDAVPPGVAVQEPGPLDAEAEAALASMEENLSGE